jgi:hypothetical protein
LDVAKAELLSFAVDKSGYHNLSVVTIPPVLRLEPARFSKVAQNLAVAARSLSLHLWDEDFCENNGIGGDNSRYHKLFTNVPSWKRTGGHMALTILVAIVALGFILGTLKRRYNFGSRQEVLRLFNGFLLDVDANAIAGILIGKQTPFKGIRLAR